MTTDTNPELQLAWEFIEKTGANVFLTGKAGTGKTTFLRELRDRSPKRMVVLAPTGIAAINAGGSTIHSFFQLPLSPYVPGASFGGREQRRYRRHDRPFGGAQLLLIGDLQQLAPVVKDDEWELMKQYS